MKSKYSDSIDPKNVLNEYPRPQLKRESYLNLNGYWDFGVSESEEDIELDKKILVPFSPESLLSGINHVLMPNEVSFYKRKVKLPENFLKDKIILHFGAVDLKAKLYINDKFVFENIGGYVPFSNDITNYVSGDEFEILLVVTDPTDTSYHLTGKQRLKPKGIFYTPQSGIWQTVWLESVSDNYIKDLTIVPLYDETAVKIIFDVEKLNNYTINIYDQDNNLLVSHLDNKEETIIKLNDFISWSPENPYLYNLEIIYGKDKVTSYFGMRKFARKLDKNGFMRFYLNNKPCFQSGVLDQGYYSDGLLTNPSDQALIDDIKTMKDLGFNMLRMHIKIAPLRWYYHCDRLGMLVWQDMLSGGENKNVVFHHILSALGINLRDHPRKIFGRTNQAGRNLYEKDLEKMLKTLKNVTSLCTWVPFNEAWGQFESKRICRKIKAFDKTRLVDHASGWSDQKVGDFYSRHVYFHKIGFKKDKARKRIAALTEFGGYSYPVTNHRYNEKEIFGYKIFNTQEKLEEALKRLYFEKVKPYIKRGLSVLVYTQVSDVENEVNGFITYDRKVLKVNKEKIRNINQEMFKTFLESVS